MNWETRDLSIRTWVNDDLRQDSSTADLIFDSRKHDRILDDGLSARVGTSSPLDTGWCWGRVRSAEIPADGDVCALRLKGSGSYPIPWSLGQFPCPRARLVPLGSRTAPDTHNGGVTELTAELSDASEPSD